MTTLLDAPCSTRDRVPDGPDLSQLSTYCPDSSRAGFSSTLSKPHDSAFEDDDDSGQVTRYSPSSFRTSTKESSPGSNELLSMPSERSNSFGFAGESASLGCHVFELADTERSISDSSLSPKTQRIDVPNGGIVSPNLLRLEDTIDCVLEKLENGAYRDSTVLSSRQMTASQVAHPFIQNPVRHNTGHLPPSPRQSPGTFTSPSWYPHSRELPRPFHEFNGYHNCDVNLSGPCVSQYSNNIAPFRTYEPNPMTTRNYGIPDATRYPSSVFYGNDSSYMPEKYRRNASRYFGPFCSTPRTRGCRTFASYTRTSHRFSPVADQNYHVNYPLSGEVRTYPTIMDRKMHYPERCVMFNMKSQSPYGEILSSSTACDAYCNMRVTTTRPNSSPRFYSRAMSPCSTDFSPMYLSQDHYARGYRYEMYDGKREQNLCNESGVANSKALVCGTVSITRNTSHKVPDVARSNLSDNKNCQLVSQPALEVCQKAQVTEESTIQECQKRPLSTVYTRCVKRRRVVASKVNSSSISSTLTENLLRSLLLHNTSQYLHDPVINLPVTLCSPIPTPLTTPITFSLSPEKARVADSTEFDHSFNRKYSQFPMFLRSPNLNCSDISLCNMLGQSTAERVQYGKLLSDNFLLKSVQKASSRTAQLSFPHYPPSGGAPSESNQLLDDLFISGRSSRESLSPVLRIRRHSARDAKSSKQTVSISRRCSRSTDYHELAIFSETLEVKNCATCSHCLMQIVTPEDAIRWRLSDNDGRIMFCSSVCLLAYQEDSALEKRFTSIPYFPGTCITSVSSLLSDEDRAVSVFLKRIPSTKWARGCGKRSVYDKVNRRRQASQTFHIRELIGIRRSTWHWFGNRWRKYHDSLQVRKKRFHSGDARTKSCLVPNLPGLLTLSSVLRSPASTTPCPDLRICRLCHQTGDAVENVAGRLLNYDFDVWLHLNCILWCYDTYETVSGSLVHVTRSLKKAEKTLCTFCGLSGAGLPCFHSECPSVYHVPCAHKIGCSFYGDRGMYCPEHATITSNYPRLTSLAVDRRVFIARDEDAQVGGIILRVNQFLDTTSIKHDVSARLRVGALVLHNVGQLLPEQLSSGLYHNSNFIYPVGYSSTRIYWSYRHMGRRCRYHCRIEDSSSTASELSISRTSILGAKFVVEVDETGEQVDSFEDITCDGVWQQILKRINQSRRAAKVNYLRIFQDHLIGETLYGLTEPHIIRAIESLPGVDRLNNYVFKFGRLQLIKEMPLAINPTGCARSEPKLRTHVRRRHASEVHANQHPLTRKPTGFHGTCAPARSSPGSPIYLASNSTIIQSKSQQYRRLRTEWELNVILARSRIQGLGLFAARDISKHTFIIEYLGELIRNEVGNRRERLYESQNRGVYMFRVDDDYIVDATMCGGLARYINHSCDPNCTAEVLSCDNGSHIIIIAKRNIEKGEELTYDYKFDIEEDRWDRIPCLCGASNCRQWMN